MPLDAKYDVLVAGAGIAGIAAALASARRGLRVALVEKTILPGGLATSGLIYVYLPLCDGHGTQVTFGLPEELLRASLRYGPGDIPPWQTAEPWPRFQVAFSPASFVLALDELLEEAGIDLWYDTLLCRPIMDDTRLTGVEVENKSGRLALTARCVIDATGDADLAFRAGAPCAEGDNWLALWALQASLETARRAVEAGEGTALLDDVRWGGDNAGRGVPAGSKKWSGVAGREVSHFVLESRRLLRAHYAARHAAGTDRRDLFPLTLPSMPQFRTTRRILGRTQLSDGQHGQPCAESIGLVADWRKAGYVWEIPYGTLVPHGVTGLLAAGRCIAAAGDAWEVTRVIPAAAVTGEAAGTAAALAVLDGVTPDRLDVAVVQRHLREAGVALHLADVYPAHRTV